MYFIEIFIFDVVMSHNGGVITWLENEFTWNHYFYIPFNAIIEYRTVLICLRRQMNLQHPKFSEFRLRLLRHSLDFTRLVRSDNFVCNLQEKSHRTANRNT